MKSNENEYPKKSKGITIRTQKIFINGAISEHKTLVDMTVMEDKNKITSTQEQELPLVQLLDEINDENIHQEINTGLTIGKEIW